MVCIVLEIMELNGLFFMVIVCGFFFLMMDVGIFIVWFVVGIVMGLIKEGDKFVVLLDILGDEDYLGDMDFKVVGIEVGVILF